MGNAIILKDEFGNPKEGRILDVIEIDGNEYLLYAIDSDDDNMDVYIKKIIKDKNGEDDLIDIDNKEEKDKVFSMALEYLDYLSGGEQICIMRE